jgi:hypothetical protein
MGYNNKEVPVVDILVIPASGESFISRGWLNPLYKLAERVRIGFGDVNFIVLWQ